MQRIVILGGGVGGTIVANQVARQMGTELRTGALDITVISESAQHVYQPMFLYIAFDQVVPAEAQKPERDILDRHVHLKVGNAERIDREAQAVIMQDGEKISYDYLVIATGSRPAPETIPGLTEGGHIFYTEEGALKLREALHNFQGGRIVVTVGVPHKCPVAPLEFTFMVQEWMKARGLGDKTELVYTYPIGRIHSLEPVANWATPVFAERGIESHIYFNPENVDPAKRTITSLEGETLNYDLLVAIPPHRGQDIIGRSELGDAGNWIPTDRYSLRMEGADNIFVLGDATNLPISKAGSTAHFEADVVAANLVNLLRGGLGSVRYDGKVFCFIETGLKNATYIQFDYAHPPKPQEPTEMIHMFKLAYNRMYWLTPAGVL
ncbi:MAG: NAD(P)/FAD-dependent oxidoreductase [Sulfobacillus thermosulfidooxidans]|uniref:NAD(P)/FAD-dependent oxidoreductase n=1 Tax=Sulfobacillus TaxID=28033 RepID=UPI000CD2E9E4|nr:FAD/NAD(P)-binding oxidoreductase [Sulfobacillus sp. hq2]MCY0909416.1 FAD/NAD(P)-binding oxidoreductase [Sulfobacillus thermotolerans]POB10014.1 pyridine nucleotide-disulfide oxidoreductase [Sulfobacillus sp. hq2]PSR36440.1 MAG: NAD(P)/FAD-dependent oxidoreductase [Sulfobacillus thermosulfidooxidans]